jgi:hypothetical protein
VWAWTPAVQPVRRPAVGSGDRKIKLSMQNAADPVE